MSSSPSKGTREGCVSPTRAPDSKGCVVTYGHVRVRARDPTPVTTARGESDEMRVGFE